MCTRVVYSGTNKMAVTGRSMDWKTEMHSNLWVFPKGMERNGETGVNSLQWTSKYGSVVTSAFEIASTDGINEKGLVANLLWLPETEYPVRDKSKPGLAITAWVQYMLDNFASVDEAVSFIDENTFQVVSDKMPDGSRLATLHLSISDATSDCAIFEYIGGKLTVYHDYEGIEKWYNGKWKAQSFVAVSYVEFVRKYASSVDVSFVKVEAHTGNPLNEEADRLAKAALGIGLPKKKKTP